MCRTVIARRRSAFRRSNSIAESLFRGTSINQGKPLLTTTFFDPLTGERSLLNHQNTVPPGDLGDLIAQPKRDRVISDASISCYADMDPSRSGTLMIVGHIIHARVGLH